VTLKLPATAAVALTTISAAAAGVTSIASVDKNVSQTQLAVFGAPLPMDPAPLPSPGDLVGVLNGLQDTSVPFADSIANNQMSRSSAMTLLRSVSG
jgi:hypothetical protein